MNALALERGGIIVIKTTRKERGRAVCTFSFALMLRAWRGSYSHKEGEGWVDSRGCCTATVAILLIYLGLFECALLKLVEF